MPCLASVVCPHIHCLPGFHYLPPHTLPARLPLSASTHTLLMPWLQFSAPTAMRRTVPRSARLAEAAHCQPPAWHGPVGALLPGLLSPAAGPGGVRDLYIAGSAGTVLAWCGLQSPWCGGGMHSNRLLVGHLPTPCPPRRRSRRGSAWRRVPQHQPTTCSPPACTSCPSCIGLWTMRQRTPGAALCSRRRQNGQAPVQGSLAHALSSAPLSQYSEKAGAAGLPLSDLRLNLQFSRCEGLLARGLLAVRLSAP